MTVVASRTTDHRLAALSEDLVVPERSVTVFTARVAETRGLLARIAVQLNPYDVRELRLCFDECTLHVVVGGRGFDAGRVAARLDKIIGVLDVTYS
ncbi:MAG TPA: hypothetical protein VFT31_00045 [Kribbella sp.]|nr:hypothetical protein [Kribbella sp.]